MSEAAVSAKTKPATALGITAGAVGFIARNWLTSLLLLVMFVVTVIVSEKVALHFRISLHSNQTGILAAVPSQRALTELVYHLILSTRIIPLVVIAIIFHRKYLKSFINTTTSTPVISYLIYFLIIFALSTATSFFGFVIDTLSLPARLNSLMAQPVELEGLTYVFSIIPEPVLIFAKTVVWALCICLLSIRLSLTALGHVSKSARAQRFLVANGFLIIRTVLIYSAFATTVTLSSQMIAVKIVVTLLPPLWVSTLIVEFFIFFNWVLLILVASSLYKGCIEATSRGK